ncbi:hypothetical protein FSST1_003039 [Fusarium sambucinum]
MAAVEPQTSAPKDTIKCVTCRRGFANKKNLQRHRRTKHPKQQPATSTTQATLEQALSQLVSQSGPFGDIQVAIRDGTFHFSAKLRNLEQPATDAINQTNTNALNNNQSNQASHIKQESQPQVTLEAPVQQMGESSSVHQAVVQNPLSCTLCNKTFNSQRALDNHSGAKHNAIKCPHCKRSFRSQKGLDHHQRDKHPPPRISPPRQIKKEPGQPSEPIVHTQPPVCQYPTDFNEFKPPIEHITTSAANQHAVALNYRLMTPPRAYSNNYRMEYDAPEPPSGPITTSFANQHPVDLDDRPMSPQLAYPSGEEDGYRQHSGGSDSDLMDDERKPGPSIDDIERDEGEDEEDEEDDIWPEYGERLSGMSCLADYLGCSQIFHKASGMLYHIETCHQDDFLWKTPDELFNSISRYKEGRKLYNHGTNLYYCPNCRGTQRGIFRSLSFLVKHAESNICDLKVRSGPIGELRDAVDRYAERKSVFYWEEH